MGPFGWPTLRLCAKVRLSAPTLACLSVVAIRPKRGSIIAALRDVVPAHQAILVQLLVQGHPADAEFGGHAQTILVEPNESIGDAGAFGLLAILRQGDFGRRGEGGRC